MAKNNLRNRQHLDLAHDINECQVGVPGVCKGYEPDGCEPMHANYLWAGIGMGIKADDVFAAGCKACHDVIDGNTKSSLTKEEKAWFWMRGAIRTWALLLRLGRLKVMPRRRLTL